MQADISRAQATLIVWVNRIRATKFDSHIKSFRQVWRTQLRLSPTLPAARLPFLRSLCNLMKSFRAMSKCRYRVKARVSETVCAFVFRNFYLAMVIFDEKMLRKTFGLNNEDVTRENCINRSFAICWATLGSRSVLSSKMRPHLNT
jgi:hypothetical protein